MLATTFEWGFRADGWLHLVHDGHDIVRGPLGVLLYLVFVPFYGWIRPAQRSLFLVVTSVLLALATLGPGYALTVFALVLVGLAVIRVCATPARRWLGTAALTAWFGALLVWPQPPWLPAVRPEDPVSLYFYVHWAGMGYLFLKTLHVLADTAAGRMRQPASGDFFAYLLFAPTLRMGPIYRYRAFTDQLHGQPREHRRLGTAFVRLVTGLVRLGALAAILGAIPHDRLFNHPETLSTAELIAGIYLAPMAFYLWVSGYVDLSIAVGRTMGFVVPENFNYCWRATNISDFWQRWHITLGAWLQDYIFSPLVRRRWHFFWAFLATFLLVGLWHAPWPCYLIWGLAQGLGLGVRRFWLQFWKGQRQSASPLYRKLEHLRLVRSPVTPLLGWLITFHYEIVTLTIGVDVYHAGRLVLGRLVGLVG